MMKMMKIMVCFQKSYTRTNFYVLNHFLCAIEKFTKRSSNSSSSSPAYDEDDEVDFKTSDPAHEIS